MSNSNTDIQGSAAPPCPKVPILKNCPDSFTLFPSTIYNLFSFPKSPLFCPTSQVVLQATSTNSIIELFSPPNHYV